MAVRATIASTKNVFFKRHVDQALRKHCDQDEHFEYLAIADVVYKKKTKGRLTGMPGPSTATGTKVMQMTGRDHRICVAIKATNQKTGRPGVMLVLLKPVKKGQVTKEGELPLEVCRTDGTFRTNRGANMLSGEHGDALNVEKNGEDTFTLEDTNFKTLQSWHRYFELQILDHSSEGGYSGAELKDLFEGLAGASSDEELIVTAVGDEEDISLGSESQKEDGNSNVDGNASKENNEAGF